MEHKRINRIRLSGMKGNPDFWLNLDPQKKHIPLIVNVMLLQSANGSKVFLADKWEEEAAEQDIRTFTVAEDKVNGHDPKERVVDLIEKEMGQMFVPLTIVKVCRVFYAMGYFIQTPSPEVTCHDD